MSLTGNLEDLPLLDILQIVSFSKKTGYLTIETEQGDAAVVFRDGFVVASFTASTRPIDHRFLAPEQLGTLIRSRIGMALEQLIRLREGHFGFSLTDEPPKALAGRDISHETLEVGINPQELLLDLARGMDEDRRDSSAAVEASFAAQLLDEEPLEVAEEEGPAAPPAAPAAAPPPAPAPPAEAPIAAPPAAPPEAPAAAKPQRARTEPLPAPQRPAARPSFEAPEEAPRPAPQAAVQPESKAAETARTILLVDDEEEVRRILEERFTGAGYEVVEAESPDSAVKKAGRLGKSGVPFLLVIDLGMPTSGGASFHGGFEVVKRLWKMHLHPRVLMMAESLSAVVKARAAQMGISDFVFKPGLSKLDPQQFEADLKAFAARILADVLPKMGRPRAGPREPKAPRAAPAPARTPPPAADELSQEFRVLRRRLEELRRPSDAMEISALVMRVAREFFERGILFLRKDEAVRGLGGFGPAPKGENLSLVAREVVIPLSEPSVFLEILSTHRSFTGPLPDGKWKEYLLGKIGRFKSDFVALIPLLAHREVIALLYGDNPETGREFGRLEPLEVFINQAGIALENAFLQRKLQALQQKGY